MEKKHYKFYQNKLCEYFPCHKNIAEEDFNCLFCFCPLYMLGNKCGGNFSYLDNGTKDCTNCLIPHKGNSYEYIIGKWPEISSIAKKKI